MAELAFRARRPRRRRRRRREPARLRRPDARGRADARLRVSAEPHWSSAERGGSSRSLTGPLERCAVCPARSTRAPAALPTVIWRNPRIVIRKAAPLPLPDEPAAVTRGTPGRGPILKAQALRSVLPADEVRRLGFGTSPDGLRDRPRRLRHYGDDVVRGRRAHRRRPARRASRRRGAGTRPPGGGARADRGSLGARVQGAGLPRRSEERRIPPLPRRHRRVPRADAAQLTRRAQSRGQGPGAGAVTTPTTARSTTRS